MTHPLNNFRSRLLAGALAACTFVPLAAFAGSTASFGATLSATAEVLPNASSDTGSLQATLDKTSNVLNSKITCSGRGGPATTAHFHGPAMPGANAGVALPFACAANPIEGQATLTPAQAADLMAGKWYANIHTAANPGGEIRGQVMTK